MRISSINPNNNFTGIKCNRLIETMQKNLTVELKPLVADVMEKSSTGNKNGVYTLVSADAGKRVEVVINKMKKLIEEITVFSAESNKLEEKIHYDYNKKGDIIRIIKNLISPNGTPETIKANIKYTDDGMIVSKNFEDVCECVTTFSKDAAGKQKILMEKTDSTKHTVEKLEYIEGEKLTSQVTRNNVVKFDAYGDPITGEMVSARDNLAKDVDIYWELLENGMYEKQMYFNNFETQVIRELPPSVSNHFYHNNKDLITPQNELAIKMSEYLN